MQYLFNLFEHGTVAFDPYINQMQTYLSTHMEILTTLRIKCTCGHSVMHTNRRNPNVNVEYLIKIGFPSNPKQTIILQDLIDLHFDPEALQDDSKYNCQTCHNQTKATVQPVILKASKYFCLSLNRFYMNCWTGLPAKISTFVDLSRVVTIPTEAGNLRYKIVSTSNHVDSNDPTSGHYVCVRRFGNQLFCCNDEIYTPVDQWDGNNCYVIILEQIAQRKRSLPPLVTNTIDNSDDDIASLASHMSTFAVQPPLAKKRKISENNNTNSSINMMNVDQTESKVSVSFAMEHESKASDEQIDVRMMNEKSEISNLSDSEWSPAKEAKEQK